MAVESALSANFKHSKTIISHAQLSKSFSHIISFDDETATVV